MRIVVGLPNDKGAPIQTNGNLPQTHSILKGTKQLTEPELEIIADEVISYVQKYGPTKLKTAMKVYK